MSIYVRLDLTVRVDLAKEPTRLTKAARQRAIEVAIGALPGSGHVFAAGDRHLLPGVDGAAYHVDASDSDVTEVWQE